MNKWFIGIIICVASSILPHSVMAKELERIVVADTADKFVVLIQAIRQEMEPGGRFEYIKGRSRAEVYRDLDAMKVMLEKSGSVADMRNDDRVKLFNAQEKVNGLLAKNARDRLICTYVSPVGSHLPVKQCQTLAEKEEASESARRNIVEMDRLGRQN